MYVVYYVLCISNSWNETQWMGEIAVNLLLKDKFKHCHLECKIMYGILNRYRLVGTVWELLCCHSVAPQHSFCIWDLAPDTAMSAIEPRPSRPHCHPVCVREMAQYSEACLGKWALFDTKGSQVLVSVVDWKTHHNLPPLCHPAKQPLTPYQAQMMSTSVEKAQKIAHCGDPIASNPFPLAKSCKNMPTKLSKRFKIPWYWQITNNHNL